MKVAEEVLNIDAPVETVFGIVGDSARIAEWMDEVVETEHIYNPGQPVGTRFRQVVEQRGHRREYTGEVLTYDENRLVVIDLDLGGFVMRIRYQLQELQNGVRLTYTAHCVQGKIVFRVALFMFRGLVQGMGVRALANVKRIAETEYDSKRD